MRFKSRRMLESANTEFVGIFERNLGFIGNRLRHPHFHLQSDRKLQRSGDGRLAVGQGVFRRGNLNADDIAWALVGLLDCRLAPLNRQVQGSYRIPAVRRSVILREVRDAAGQASQVRMALAAQAVCGTKAASQSRNIKCLKKQRGRSCVANTPKPM
jgi:hypothetical protein